jgi:hypothetical protein
MGHENDCRNLLDQCPIDSVNIRQLLFGFLSLERVSLRSGLAGVAEEYGGKIGEKSFRLQGTDTSPKLGTQHFYTFTFALLRRQLGSLFSDA